VGTREASQYRPEVCKNYEYYHTVLAQFWPSPARFQSETQRHETAESAGFHGLGGRLFAAAVWGGEPQLTEGFVNAPVAEVWRLFTTSEGFLATGAAQRVSRIATRWPAPGPSSISTRPART